MCDIRNHENGECYFLMSERGPILEGKKDTPEKKIKAKWAHELTVHITLPVYQFDVSIFPTIMVETNNKMGRI